MNTTTDSGGSTSSSGSASTKTSTSKPKKKPQHLTVAQIIAQVAKQYGVPPQVALALGMYESGLDPTKVGDQGSSFGIYQLHEGGELGSHSAQWAYNVRNNASTALAELARVHAQHPEWDWGTVAAAAQRPANQAAEAAAVNGYLSQYHASGQKNAVAYFTSQSSAAGRTTVSTGAPAGNADFSAADTKGMLDDLGLPKALINSNASLQAAFQKILNQKLDLSSDVGKARAMAVIKGTTWWQNHSAAQRKAITLQYDDPKEFERQLNLQSHDIHTLAMQMGIALNGKTLAQMAHLALFNGLDSNEINQLVAKHFEYTRTSSYEGQAGVDINGLKKLANDYYVNLPDQQIENMVTKMLGNGMSATDMADYFKQQAINRFPYLKQQLDSQGLTVADVASPYVQSMANILELNPSSIKSRDPHIMQALQMSDGKGGFQLMPEWQFEQNLKNDPRWLQTQNAQNSLMDVGTGVLRQMGLIV